MTVITCNNWTPNKAGFQTQSCSVRPCQASVDLSLADWPGTIDTLPQKIMAHNGISERSNRLIPGKTYRKPLSSPKQCGFSCKPIKCSSCLANRGHARNLRQVRFLCQCPGKIPSGVIKGGRPWNMEVSSWENRASSHMWSQMNGSSENKQLDSAAPLQQQFISSILWFPLNK